MVPCPSGRLRGAEPGLGQVGSKASPFDCTAPPCPFLTDGNSRGFLSPRECCLPGLRQLHGNMDGGLDQSSGAWY